MPLGTPVHKCVDKLKGKKGIGSAIAICQSSTKQSYKTGKSLSKKTMNEDSPKGWHGTIAAMRLKHPELGKGKTKDGKKKSPYAIAYYMKKKGDKPHYKDTKTSLVKTVPPKKKKYEDEDKPKKKDKMFESFNEWVERTKR